MYNTTHCTVVLYTTTNCTPVMYSCAVYSCAVQHHSLSILGPDQGNWAVTQTSDSFIELTQDIHLHTAAPNYRAYAKPAQCSDYSLESVVYHSVMYQCTMCLIYRSRESFLGFFHLIFNF